MQSIETHCALEQSLKGVVQLRIVGASEPLTITCRSLSQAEDIADLMDGYCRLVNNNSKSCWIRKGTFTSHRPTTPHPSHPHICKGVIHE